ncbi:hypothetical protein BZG36_03667 [Bifiguratus adelaidae]|uniref:Nudix hydrolase domain-containing protein n=1 Tax=Bifiguratus adelaidae TaxID=1938954 RepID=A0A261XZS5_9FUNG|nr:hypothetical protein BZG36_03667 [Bifiguratus adelaidae]
MVRWSNDARMPGVRYLPVQNSVLIKHRASLGVSKAAHLLPVPPPSPDTPCHITLLLITAVPSPSAPNNGTPAPQKGKEFHTWGCKTMRDRYVVTSFVHCKGKLLLLKRSDKVHTFQHHWCGVSGSIEGTDQCAYDRALTELQEELSVDAKDLTLVRSGRPLVIPNDDTVWHVYPFLFSMAHTSIQIDWEHETYEWIEPEKIQTFKTVPDLVQTFRSVYLPEQVHQALQQLYADRALGAQQMATKALESFADMIASRVYRKAPFECHSTTQLYNAYMTAAWYLCAIRPNMQNPRLFTLTTTLNHARQAVQDMQEDDLDDFEATVLDNVRTQIQENARMDNSLVRVFVDHVPQDARIMTLSYSSAVAACLQALPKAKVTICESRPLNEGVALAQSLKNDVQIITEAQAAVFMAECDYVVIGADALYKGVRNKVGSTMLAVLAHTVHKAEVIVVSRRDKVAPPTRIFSDGRARFKHVGAQGHRTEAEIEGEDGKEEAAEENAVEEVTASYRQDQLSQLGKVRNVYFETVPLEDCPD